MPIEVKVEFIEVEGRKVLEERFMDTVLYGIGERTKKYIEKHQSQNIIGILDGFRTDGKFCGVPVISIEELAGRNVRIIIMARKASERIIYGRIKNFCREHTIPIYNLELQRIDGKEKIMDVSHPYFARHIEELEDLMKGFDAVSFDIFDSLLLRESGDPYPIFQRMNEECSLNIDFAKERTKAELEISSSFPFIDEIYKQISRNTGIFYEDLKTLMQREIEAEKVVLRPRTVMLDVYKKALVSGKRVFLISDMYFPEAVIKEILEKNGITGYEKLYVSCEYRTDKASGLYDVYKEETKARSYLHIGNDEEKDGKSAAESGITPYIVLSPDDMANISSVVEIRKEYESLAWKLSLSRLFESPFSLYGSRGKIRVETPYNLGYCIIAPAIYSLCKWLEKKLKEIEAGTVIFIARDGFVVKKVFDLVTEGIFHTVYLPVSRTLVMRADADTAEKIISISCMSFDGTMGDMLVRRFGLKADEILPHSDDMSNIDYLKEHVPFIIQKSEKVRADYKKFLAQYDIRDGDAIFDFVSTGTCQMGLENILGIRFKGLYFERAGTDRDLDIRGFTNEVTGCPTENYFMIEPLIKENCLSICEIGPDGEIRYSNHCISGRSIETVLAVQEGIIDYATYIKESGYTKNFSEKEAKAALEILQMYDEEYMDNINFLLPENFDEFSNRKI